MMLEQKIKGYLYLVVGALLILIVIPTIVQLIIFALGMCLVGYGVLTAISAHRQHGAR